jgi:MerR family transcriptional regulator, copper efflux regulator
MNALRSHQDTEAHATSGTAAAADMPPHVFWPVNIGLASRMSGVTPKMVRHYESLGLLPPVARTDSGYRQYSEAEVHTLRFIKRSRELGFSMNEIAELVGLWRNRRRTSASVKRIAQKHSQDLAQRIEAMQAMQRTLRHLIHCCHGDERPDCPILDDLAGLRA